MNWVAAVMALASLARAVTLVARDWLARGRADALRRLRRMEHAHERLSRAVAARNRADGIDGDDRLRGKDGVRDPYQRD
jgi:hypothetical protein